MNTNFWRVSIFLLSALVLLGSTVAVAGEQDKNQATASEVR